MLDPNAAVRAARRALADATAARAVYDRHVARVEREACPKYRFAVAQIAAAQGDKPDVIAVRANREVAGLEIKWDVIVRADPAKSMLGFKDRRSADRYAVAVRSRGMDARVLQQGLYSH